MEPHDTRLVSISHLLFTVLTVLDAVIDDELATEHSARGAVQRSNEILKEINAVMRKGEA